MWAVEEVGKKSNEQILDLLQKQNTGISTAKWKVYRRETETDEKKVRLTLWVDNESYEYLKAQDLKLFLGLNRAKFLLWSDWNKLKSSSTEHRAPERTMRRPANYQSSRPRYLLQLSGKYEYVADKTVSPWLVPPRTLSRNTWTPSSGSRAWGTGLSDPNPRHRVDDQYWSQSQLDYFREAQFASSDPLLSREYMESAALQDWRSRYLASETPAFGKSEWPQLGEARYTSDRALENWYFGSESHYPLETVDRIPYPRSLLETSYADSYWALPRDSTSVIANRDKPKDSRPSVWLTGSGEPLSSVSRYSNLYEPHTETAVLPSLGSALEQPHARGFGMSELPQSQESSYSVLARAQHREPRYSTDRSQENKYFTSDSRQRLEPVYAAPEPPQIRDSHYTASDRATSRNFESVTANRDRSRDSRYVPPNRDRSDNTRFRDSDRLPSPVSGLSDLDEPVTETGTFQNRTSTYLSSEQPRERGYGASELSKLREASYSVSERAQSRGSRYTSDRRQDDKYSNSADRHRTLEAVRGDPYPPPLLGASRADADRALPRDSESVTKNRDRSRDLRYVPPDRDRSDNTRFRGSDRLASPVSGLSDLDEPVTESAMHQNRTSTVLSSQEPRERGYEMSELPKLREAGYSVLGRTQSRESRYTSDRHQGDRYLTSDQTTSRLSKSAIPGRDTFRSSPSLTANRDRSRDSEYVPPNRDLSETVSRFRDPAQPLTEPGALARPREAGYGVSDRAPPSESRYTSDRLRDEKYSPSDSRQPPKTIPSLLDLPQLRGTNYTTSDLAPSRNSASVTANRDRPRDSRYVPPGREQSENAGLRDSNWPLSLDSRLMQPTEGRFEEREYTGESRLRLSDPQQYRESDNTVSRTRSPERLGSPWIQSRFSRFVDSSKTKW